MQIGDRVIQSYDANMQDAAKSEQTKTAGQVHTTEQGNHTQSSTDVSNLKEGTVFRGEILEISGEKVKIALSDKSQLPARLQGDVKLGVGDQLLFSVKENTTNQILIKPMFDSLYSAQTQVLERALDAAGLSPTEKNFSVAKELMEAGMSLDKGNMVKLLSQSMKFEGTSMQTLVALNKMNFPVTEANIAQYDRYQGYQHQLSGDISNVANEISAFTKAFPEGTSGMTLVSVADHILDLFTQNSSEYGNEIREAPLVNEGSVLPEQSGTMMKDGTMSEQTGAVMKDGSMLEQTGAVMKDGSMLEQTGAVMKDGSILEQTGAVMKDGSMSEQTGASINGSSLSEQVGLVLKEGVTADRTGSLMQDGNLVNQTGSLMQDGSLVNQTGSLMQDGSLVEQTGSLMQDGSLVEQTGSLMKGGSLVEQTGSLIQDRILEEQISSFSKDGMKPVESRDISDMAGKDVAQDGKAQAKATISLSHISETTGLTKEEFQHITNLLGKAGVTREQLQNMFRNVDSTEDLLKNMLQKLTTSGGSEQAIHDVLDSNEFRNMLADVVKKHWALNPKDMKDPKEIDELYDRILKQSRSFENLISAKGGETGKFEQSFQNMRQNMQFMDQLNQQMIYAQMPIKLSNQNANSELYVYANKRKLANKTDGISVMLHLDMDHLGQTDVKITLTGSNVNARFYLNDHESVEIVAENMNQLAKQLADRGYSLTNEVIQRQPQESVNQVVDEIIDENAERSIKRYTFDARM